MMLGTLAAAAKKDGEVESYLRQAQQAHPKSAAPGVQLVRFYAAGKNWSRATALGRELAVQFPNDLAVLDLLVEVRAASGDIAGATADVQHLMERFPKSPQLLIQLAGFEMKRNDLTDARQSLLRAIALAPNNDSYMEALVDLDFKTKGADAALATARSFAPKHAELSGLSVARVLANAKRPAAALAALEALQRQHPSTAIAIRIAEFTYETGKHDQAVAFLLAWLKEHQDATVARFMIATFYLQDRESHKAQAEYERVLAETPANALAANNLANIYEDESDPRALALAERAYRELPSAQIGDTLGWILLRAGDRPRAMFYLRNAGAAVPANLTIQYHLAVGLDQTGDKKNAIALLERVVSSSRPFADKSDAEKLLAKLQHG
jgi:predicted Zn-dependent protease